MTKWVDGSPIAGLAIEQANGGSPPCLRPVSKHVLNPHLGPPAKCPTAKLRFLFPLGDEDQLWSRDYAYLPLYSWFWDKTHDMCVSAFKREQWRHKFFLPWFFMRFLALRVRWVDDINSTGTEIAFCFDNGMQNRNKFN